MTWLITMLLLVTSDYPPSPPPTTDPAHPPPPAVTVQPSPVGNSRPPDDRRTLMGEIDKAYKAEKERADLWRALADDAADLIANPSFNPGWFTKRNEWQARWREASQR